MIRKISIVINWAAILMFAIGVGSQIKENPNTFAPGSLFPFLAYATALANYHFPPKLPMVWTSLALNVFGCTIALVALVAILLGRAERPGIAAAGVPDRNSDSLRLQCP